MQKFILNIGIKLGLLQVLIQVSQYFLSSDLNDLLNPRWEFSALNILVIIGFIVFAIKRVYSIEKTNKLKKALKIAVGISITASIIVGIYKNIIFTHFLEPNYMDFLEEKQVLSLSKKGYSDEDIERYIAITKKMSTPWITLPMGMIYSAFWGVVIGLITGAILKRKKHS